MNVYYDYVFIGAGVINLLEAVHQKNTGKKVIVLEKTAYIAGAWRPIKLANYNNVENAIHYFLQDQRGLSYINDVLGWKLEKSKNKFQISNIFKSYYLLFHYDNFLSKLIRVFKKQNGRNLFNLLLCIYKDVFNNNKSVYLKKGSPFIYGYLKELINKKKLKILFNQNLKSIKCVSKDKIVKIHLGKKVINAKKLIITHGTDLLNVYINNKKIIIPQHIHKRPAIHLLISGQKQRNIDEGIMTHDPVVKYFHDVTKFVDSKSKISKELIFVFGLHPNVKNSKKTYTYLLSLLKKLKVVSKDADILHSHWSDLKLPTLYDEDLQLIKKKSFSLIDFLKTENFTAGIGLNSYRWGNLYRR